MIKPRNCETLEGCVWLSLPFQEKGHVSLRWKTGKG